MRCVVGVGGDLREVEGGSRRLPKWGGTPPLPDHRQLGLLRPHLPG